MGYTVIREYLQKLKNKKGSALLLSLLFSIVTIIIATVILNAAVSSSRRVEDTAESSQAYYLVSSLFSEFDYEATSPKLEGSTVPNGGMKFTAGVIYVRDGVTDPEEEKAKYEAELITNIAAELESRTNMNALKDHVAYCLAKAMFENTTVRRNFRVEVGGTGSTADLNCTAYWIDGTVSVNPLDYSIQITVTGFPGKNGSNVDPGIQVFGLPEVCTLVIPTEKVEIEKKQSDAGFEFPTSINFEYQRAKYLTVTEK